MDRRQRKTRNAIFQALIYLLSQKDYSKITIEQIIAQADIGRATFYAHFETKDYLLKALCQELFAHIFAAQTGAQDAHGHLFDCEISDNVYLHLFHHLQKNDNHILDLLSGRNNELFLAYFRENLRVLVASQLHLFAHRKAPELPESFWVDHIASVFTQSVKWWVENGMGESPEVITNYFMQAV